MTTGITTGRRFIVFMFTERLARARCWAALRRLGFLDFEATGARML
jgi:hypothetical protein